MPHLTWIHHRCIWTQTVCAFFVSRRRTNNINAYSRPHKYDAKPTMYNVRYANIYAKKNKYRLNGSRPTFADFHYHRIFGCLISKIRFEWYFVCFLYIVCATVIHSIITVQHCSTLYIVSTKRLNSLFSINVYRRFFAYILNWWTKYSYDLMLTISYTILNN